MRLKQKNTIFLLKIKKFGKCFFYRDVFYKEDILYYKENNKYNQKYTGFRKRLKQITR